MEYDLHDVVVKKALVAIGEGEGLPEGVSSRVKWAEVGADLAG